MGMTEHMCMQVLLPMRFLSLVGHWVTCLTLLLDRVRHFSMRCYAARATRLVEAP